MSSKGTFNVCIAWSDASSTTFQLHDATVEEAWEQAHQSVAGQEQQNRIWREHGLDEHARDAMIAIVALAGWQGAPDVELFGPLAQNYERDDAPDDAFHAEVRDAEVAAGWDATP